jgi:hypothetical protein
MLYLFSILFSFSMLASPWVKDQSFRFGILDSFARTQGFAFDGLGNFWFSGKKSLQRTQKTFGNIIIKNRSPLTEEMQDLGDNHIGGIDYHAGKIIVPIEDGNAYQHPFVGLYDSKSLKLIKSYPLPAEWQKDGAPWVAVWPEGHGILSSEYSNVTKINVYDGESLAPVRQIEMSMKINAIQGAHVFGNSLFMSSDDMDKKGFAVYEMDLDSGKVTKVLRLPENVTEVEGISLNDHELYVLTVTGSGIFTRSELFRYLK